MKPFMTWINSKKGKIWFSLGLQLFLLVLFLLWMEPGYGDNFMKGNTEDRLMGLVSNQNGLLRLLYRILYGSCGTLPWYTLLQTGALFLAFSAVTCMILRRQKGTGGLFAVLMLMVYFGYESYIRMDYGKTAAVLSAAAFFLIYCGSEKKEAGRTAMFSGVLLGFLGFLYSPLQFFLCALLMIWFGAVWLRRTTEKREPLLLYFGMLAILAGLILGGWKADRILYEKTEGWQYDRDCYMAREHLRDYGFPDYQENKSLYQQLGITKKDLKRYQKKEQNQTQDPLEELSLETMQALSAAKPRERLSKALILLFLNQFSVLWFRSGTFLCFLILAIFWIFWGKWERRIFFLLLAEGCLTGALYFCMFYRERNSCSDLDLAIWFSLSLVMLLCLAGEKWKLSAKVQILFLMALLIANQSSWHSWWRFPLKAEKEGKQQEKYAAPYELVTGSEKEKG